MGNNFVICGICRFPGVGFLTVANFSYQYEVTEQSLGEMCPISSCELGGESRSQGTPGAGPIACMFIRFSWLSWTQGHYTRLSEGAEIARKVLQF